MGFLIESVVSAAKLAATMDPAVYGAAFVSLTVAGVATSICGIIGIPAGYVLAVRRFRGRQITLALLNTMLALPTVVVGLFVYSFLTRRSLLGPLDLLFTKRAMVIGEVLLGLPIVVALTHTAIASLDRSVRETALTLGAGPVRAAATVVWEGRFALLAALTTAFGRVVGEVGIAMMLGGNIAGYTRTLTTALTLETSKGEFSLAMALGMVLLAAALVVNFVLRYVEHRSEAA